MYLFITVKPSHLPFGIMACVLLYQFDGSLAVVFAVKEAEQFSVAHGLQAGQVAEGIDTPRFLLQAWETVALRVCSKEAGWGSKLYTSFQQRPSEIIVK